MPMIRSLIKQGFLQVFSIVGENNVSYIVTKSRFENHYNQDVNISTFFLAQSFNFQLGRFIKSIAEFITINNMTKIDISKNLNLL